MPSPELAAQLADLGGMALAILLVLLGLIGLHRQWWAPGWLLRDLHARLKALEEENAAWRRLYLDGLTGSSGDHGERDDPFSARERKRDPLG